MCRLQDAADAGRIGGILKAVTGHEPSFLMESLRHGEETITDGSLIHSTITSFYAKWFRRLPGEQIRDKELAECVLTCDYQRWVALTSEIGIPTDVSNTL